MDSMKLRLIAMGGILIVLSIVLSVLRGFGVGYIGILIVGIILAVIGVLWKPRKKADEEKAQQK